MKPKDAKTFAAVCKLKQDGIDCDDAWIQINGPDINEIVIANQKPGKKATGEVFLTRRQFQKFVDWWEGK